MKFSLKEPPYELVDSGFRGIDRRIDEPFVAPDGFGRNSLGRYMLASKLRWTKDRGHPFQGRILFINGQESWWDIF